MTAPQLLRRHARASRPATAHTPRLLVLLAVLVLLLLPLPLQLLTMPALPGVALACRPHRRLSEAVVGVTVTGRATSAVSGVILRASARRSSAEAEAVPQARHL